MTTDTVTPSVNSHEDVLTQQARKKASTYEGTAIEQETLAQLLIQNHFLTVQVKDNVAIKGHLMFYTIVMILAMLTVLFNMPSFS